MVKGTKRKIEIAKITNKCSMATCFTKRSHGLYSKASQLCLLSGAQIAILATPSSSQSNVSFYSFGHSSVEAVVSAFLAGQSPVPVSEESKQMREDIAICLARKDLGLGFWWDDERLDRSENPEEIKDAIESMKSLLSDVKRLRAEDAVNFNQREALVVIDEKNNDMKKNDVVLHHHGTDQTLIIDDANFNDTAEDDQILSISDSVSNNNNALLSAAGNLDEWSDMDLDQLLNGFDDLPQNLNQKTEEEDQVVAISENSCNNNNALLPAAGNLDEWSDMDLDQLLNGFDDLPQNLNENTEEEDQFVAISENSCNNNNALLPAGNSDDDQELDLDFETIFEGLGDQDFDEFAATFMI